jgi:hypothetical protein
MNEDFTHIDECPIEECDEKIRIAPEKVWWLKLMRTPEVLELIEAAPLAFTLASIIALRARFKKGFNPINGLFQGEAFLGDHKKYGMTMQQYRTAKAQLKKWKFATFRSTSRGTIARLTDTRLFDVLNESANRQPNRQPTTTPQVTYNAHSVST